MRGTGLCGYIRRDTMEGGCVAERERYQPTAEQSSLAEMMGDALEAVLPIARLHQTTHETADTWQALSDLGLFSMTTPEAEGGAGLGPVEEVLVAFELGRRLASPAVLATLAVAPHIALEPGEAVAAAWTEDGGCVLVAEPGAERALVRISGRGRLIDRPETIEVLDEAHWAASLGRIAPQDGLDGLDLPDETRLRLLDAAALAGLAATARDMAVSYAGFRQQFGRPIGSFQAVKHHCADMALAARGARDLVAFAAVAFAEGAVDAASLAESALIVSGSAAVRNAALNVQIHGGVGFSDEADPHLLVKRARLYVSIAGGLDAAIERTANQEFAA